MFYCYILYSEVLDKYYIGYTGDIPGRIRRHLSNHKGFTGHAPDWELKWSKEFMTKVQAQQFERKIKSWKSRLMIERLIAES